jgi:S-DNA-T family DNA segregation ATPase FtsK/SpoIIIE
MTKRSPSRAPARAPRRKSAPGPLLTSAQRNWLVGLVALALALVTFLSLLSSSHGTLTALWLEVLWQGLGWGIYAVPVGLAILGLWVITLTTTHPLTLPWTRLAGAAVLLVDGLALTQHLIEQPADAAASQGGGILGVWLSQTLSGALGWAGALVIMVLALGIGLTLLLEVSLAQVFADGIELVRRFLGWVRQRLFFRRSDRAFAEGADELPLVTLRPPLTLPPQPTERQSAPTERLAAPGAESSPAAESPAPLLPPLAPRAPGAPPQWTLPRPQDLLMVIEEKQMSLDDIRAKSRLIEETLRSLGVPVEVTEVNPGPVVTQFGLEPGYVERRDRDGNLKKVKIKVSRIAALANDLSLALAASPIRIEAPVPGKGVVGLEIPNHEMATVGLRGVMEADEFAALADKPLALAMGRDVSGMAVVDDLSSLPHLLIAGATGSGKSVCINAFIACLLLRNTPETLRFLMIDPKRVELSSYNGIPHLLAPVVVDAERVVGVLTWVTREMERRYKAFAEVGARNVQGYNELMYGMGGEKLPFIVVCIDELADLMMVAPEEVERALCRIAQMARATGIHLIVATQRPSVDVVTGLIKANFPARLSFAVSSQIDSRVILDTPGAEKLLGRGDALYMAPDSPKLERIQGCWVSDGELAHLVAFWTAQVASPTPPQQLEIPLDAARSGEPLVQRALWPPATPPTPGGSDEDPLLREAIALVRAEKKASVSFLQRHLRIGYTRAARLVDILESKGIVGPSAGASKMRDVPEEPPPVPPTTGAAP